MIKINRYKTVLIAILFMSVISIKSIYAYDSVTFKNINIKDGLSQSTVQAMLQDSKGYIWLGTNDGLNRYNGYDMKVYINDTSKESISDNYILNITEDKKGNVWVATCYGLSKININSGKVKNYYDDKDSGNLSHYYTSSILITEKNDVLVGTSDGINIYDEETDSFKRILDEKDDITSQDISNMKMDIEGNIWIATRDGLNKINIKSKKIDKYYSEGENRISGNDVYGLLSDKNGYIWASTRGYGLNRINIKTNEITIYKYDEKDEKSIPENYTRNMLQDKRGDIWIGTDKGLAKYIAKDDNFITYENKQHDANSLINNTVYTVIEDKSGLIWVGTYAGISIFDPSHRINHYKNDPFNTNSLSDNVIHGIYEDEEGLIWVGTKDNGVNIINRETNEVKHINKGDTKFDLNSNSVKVITGKSNTIWIGSREGLNKVNKKDMTVKSYTTKDGLAGDNIRSLLLDSKGYLWIGTPDGLSILNTKDDSIIDVTQILKDYGIDDIYIEEIYEDRDGIYWIGTFIGGGLIKIDPNSTSEPLKNYKNTDGENGRNNNNINTIRSIVEDKYGYLWIGTNYGLNKFDKINEKFTTYTQKDGLANNTVYGVLLDNKNNPWVSTNNGISKLDINTKEFRNLSVVDGLQSNEFNGKAAYKGRNGEFMFGGISGLNTFNPDEIVNLGYCPDVIFDDFEVQGKVYKNINNKVFSYDENTIRIKYFIPDYKNNKNIQYQYKMEGLNDKWILVNNNEAIYSDLDPGEYTFKIKARSQNGVMGKESSLTFTINPPFWKSQTAMVLYAIIIIIIIYRNTTKVKRLDILVEKRTKQLRDEMKKNNKLLNQVIKLEKNKNNYFINLSHELRTPLNVINSIEQLITELNKSENGISRDKLAHYMDVMKKNSKRLLNLINNIIDTNKIEHGNYKINLDKYDIVYIVEEGALGLKEYVESKEIELIIDTDIEEKYIICDEDEIDRCIVNLVSNAAKFTPKGGKIKVNIADLKDKVKIIVKDTGIGIDEKYHKSIFDRFNQVIDPDSETKGGSGLGLTITKHIIELHKGEIYVESKKNEGSEFIIILPTNIEKI